MAKAKKLVAKTKKQGGLTKLIKRYPFLPWSSLFVFIGAAICALAYRYESEAGPPPFELTTYESDYLRGVVAAVTALGLVALLAIRRYKPTMLDEQFLTRAKAAVILLVIAGSLIYFYAPRGIARRHYLNFHDLYHYFLGLKYYPEVSYNNFYACHLQADQERPRPRYRARDRVRDLNDYRRRRASDILAQADCSAFSEERWREFRHDIDLFDRFMGRRALLDHGYNGTPFHALVGGTIANIPEVTYSSLVVLTFVDILMLSLLFAVLVWGFGWPAAVLFALFLFSNFADFYFHVSFFRYSWFFTLGIGLACLHRERYAPAAVFLTASAMLNVFPLLFSAGLVLKIVVSWLKEKSLTPHHKTFVTWAVASTILFGALSVTHDEPLERYRSFFSNMSMHSPKLTTKRIGFRYNFMYRGEITEDSPQISYDTKAEDFRRIRVPYTIIVALILALGAALALRLDDFRATVLMGFLLFFILFSTVAYYYAVASVLVLLWARELDKNRGVAFMILLFGLMATVYLFWWQTQFRKFVNNHVLTMLFTVYLAAVMYAYARETGLTTTLKERLGTWFKGQDAEGEGDDGHEGEVEGDDESEGETASKGKSTGTGKGKSKGSKASVFT